MDDYDSQDIMSTTLLPRREGSDLNQKNTRSQVERAHRVAPIEEPKNLQSINSYRTTYDSIQKKQSYSSTEETELFNSGRSRPPLKISKDSEDQNHSIDDSLTVFSLDQWNDYQFSPASDSVEEVALPRGLESNRVSSSGISSYLTPNQPMMSTIDDSYSQVYPSTDEMDINNVSRILFDVSSSSIRKNNFVVHDTKVPLWQKKVKTRIIHYFLSTRSTQK